MMRSIWPAILLCALAVAPARAADEQSFETIERGRYLAILGDCSACHTAPGGQTYAGGVVLKTPFCNLAAPNITMDRATGIGGWTSEQFYRALHDGVSANGAHLYPAMPYPSYTKMTRAETDAIWTYLLTIQPVENAVVANQLPFPFNIRTSLLAWNALNFTEGVFQPDKSQCAEWNRGAYIVQGPGHCGTCHTPKNFMGADKSSQFLQGEQLQGWVAPKITADERRGIGSWSEDDIVRYLKTGSNGHNLVSGPMSEEVAKSSSRWTDADVKAVAVYLKSLKPNAPEAAQPVAGNDSAMTAGQAIYDDRCSGCHKQGGGGIPNLFTALPKNPVVQQNDPTSLIRIVLMGSRAGGTESTPTTPGMPSFSRTLNDDEVAAVLTYVRNSWGNAAPAVSAGSVSSVRAAGPGE